MLPYGGNLPFSFEIRTLTYHDMMRSKFIAPVHFSQNSEEDKIVNRLDGETEHVVLVF
jgi:hypothetical protein